MLLTISILITNLVKVVSFFALASILLQTRVKTAKGIFASIFLILVLSSLMMYGNNFIDEPFRTIGLIAISAIVMGFRFRIPIRRTMIVSAFSMMIILAIIFVSTAITGIVGFAINDFINDNMHMLDLLINIPVQILIMIFLIKMKIFDRDFPFLREKHGSIIVIVIYIAILCLCSIYEFEYNCYW